MTQISPEHAYFTRRLGIVCLASAAVTLLLYIAGDYTLPGGSVLFTEWADAIAKGTKLPIAVTQRDVGFPLLLFLTGYTHTGSFAGMTLMHVLFSFSIPPIIYLSIGRDFPKTAYFTALATILSLAPFQYMKWVHHDQLFLFLNVLTLYAFAVFARSRSYLWIYFLTFAVLASSLTRPAGNFVYLMLFPLAVCLRPKLSIHYVLAPVLFFSAIYAYNGYRHSVFDVAAGEKMPGYTGQQVFYNLYVNSREEGIRLNERELPHFKQLMDKLRKAVAPVPKDSQMIRLMTEDRHYSPAFRDAAFGDTDVESFIQRFQQYPNYEYFELLSNIVGYKDDNIFLQASREIAEAYPLYTARYISRNLYYYFWRPGYVHGRDSMAPIERASSPPFLLFTKGQGVTPQPVAANGLEEVSYNFYEHAAVPFQLGCRFMKNVLKTTYKPLSQISCLFMLVALFSWGAVAYGRLAGIPRLEAFAPMIGKMTAPLLASLVILFYNALVSSAFAEPSYRYHFHTIIFQIVAAGYGATVFFAALRNWRLNQPLSIGQCDKQTI